MLSSIDEIQKPPLLCKEGIQGWLDSVFINLANN